MMELIIICSTVLIIYFHAAHMFWCFKDLEAQVLLKERALVLLNKELGEQLISLKAKLEYMDAHTSDMRTELNAVNLRLGMKLT